MCTTAFCKTEAVQTFSSLLKQRRRWFLGYITNEVCMLTDVRLWRRYPLLCLVRLLQNTIRTTALLFFILLIAIITSSSRVDDLPVGFVVISLGLNYTLMFYFGLKLKRYKAWLYPLMFIMNPFFNWLYMVYGIFTAGHRTWGGPRTDAARADEHTTPAQAARQAEEQGDELNVEVETFRSGVEGKGVPVRPPRKITGRFSAEELMPPKGCYDTLTDSEAGLTKFLSPLPEIPRIGLHSPWSTESVLSSESGWESIDMPHNVESLVNEERLYLSRKVQDPAAARLSVETSSDVQSADSTQSPRVIVRIDRTKTDDDQASFTTSHNRGSVADSATETDEASQGPLTQSSYDSTEPLTAARRLSDIGLSHLQRVSQTPKMAKITKKGNGGLVVGIV
jgi:chitin synthase